MRLWCYKSGHHGQTWRTVEINSQNSILFGLREIYVSIVVRDVDDDIERLGPCSSWPLTDCCQFYILQSEPGWLRVSWENEREQCVQHGGFETVGGSWH
jgi:hypothetical protein